MMTIPYNPLYHRKLLITCLEKHNMPATLIDTLPNFGLVTTHLGEIVAAGFLRRMEGYYAMIDGYITNPEARAELRNRALDHITYKLIKIAKANDIVRIVCLSTEDNIVKRAIVFGFQPQPHLFLAINL